MLLSPMFSMLTSLLFRQSSRFQCSTLIDGSFSQRYFLAFQDYIADFSELDPDLLVTLILENDLPMSTAKQKLVQNEMNYAKRLRSLSSPSKLAFQFLIFVTFFTL